MKQNKINKNVGMLYIVGTPIGNLGDITLRAIETLQKVDVILAEDTRNTLKLLNHLKIEKHMESYHRHNEEEKLQKIVRLLDEGKDLALVSDAGMPIISDPGHSLVKYLIKNGYNVEVVPGVTALISAMVMSSFDANRFSFEGFLSINKKQRKARLEELQNETRTMIFYEAPHKILDTLKDMYVVFGSRNICIAREITKLYQQFIYTTIDEEIKRIEENGIKGEIVIVIEGKNEDVLEEIRKENIDKIDELSLVKDYMNKGIEKKEAIKMVAKLKGITKNSVYQKCIELEKYDNNSIW